MLTASTNSACSSSIAWSTTRQFPPLEAIDPQWMAGACPTVYYSELRPGRARERAGKNCLVRARARFDLMDVKESGALPFDCGAA